MSLYYADLNNPSRRLIEKALVPDRRFVARPSHWMVGQMGAFGGGTGFSGPYGYGYSTPNQMSLLSEMGGAAAGQQLGQVAQSSLQRGMNIPPPWRYGRATSST